MKKKLNPHVVIVGGGMAGLTLSCILAQQNPDLSVTLIDKDKPSDQLTHEFDGRTTAISYASSKVLHDAGVWSDIVDKGQPITTIDVQDNHSPIILNFDAKDVDDKPFGWILENRLIRFSLQSKARNLKNLRYITSCTVSKIETVAQQAMISLNTGQALTADLVIGADGRMSTVREWADIDLIELDYRQKATVCLVKHEKPHHGLAVERFMSDGPFAILPFTDDDHGHHRSALVWTEHGRHMRNFNTVSEDVFNLELQKRFDERYGAVELAGYRAQYPLKLYHAKELKAQRIALIGDAAHAIHPIAGQGLNLGMQDINVLSDLIHDALLQNEDIGANKLLNTYQKNRRFEIFAMVAATDLLNRLFSNNHAPMRILRNLGLGAVDKIPPLKKFFMRTAMGLNSQKNQ